MKRLSLTVAVAAILMAGCAMAQSVPANVTAAVTAERPEADVARDDLRKPAEMLVFAGVTPGMKIGELLPGGGYFTRIFSRAVGAEGHVYGVINPPNPERPAAVKAIAADPAFANVSVIEGPIAQFASPEPLDLVWTSQNYHDVPVANRGPLNAAVFAALKPGGTYVVLDHSAAPGTGPTNELHRMDEAVARAQIEAAGFEYVGSSGVLRNPSDDRTKRVFEADLRGHTDQFVLKFRKPA